MMRWMTAVLVLSSLLASCGQDKSTAPPLNRPPTIVALADTSIAVGDTLKTRAEAADPEGDELRYQLVVAMTLEEFREGYRAQAEMNGTSGEFWFAPTSTDRPRRRLTIEVMDAHGARDSTTFLVEVP